MGFLRRLAASVFLGSAAGTFGWFIGQVATSMLGFPDETPWALLIIVWTAVVGYGMSMDTDEAVASAPATTE